MEFARAELAKYGWSEGKGLGATESGITRAIKPTLKFDQCGIGHDVGKEFNFHWWDHVYNKAVNNISVNTLENGSVELKREKDLVVTTKVPSKLASKKKIHGGNFVLGGMLVGAKEIIKSDSDSSDSEDEVRHDMLTALSDDQLFKICGGLTAHKGARHGINMTAKLKRIQNQDENIDVISKNGDKILPKVSNLDKKLNNKVKIKKKKNKNKKRSHEIDNSAPRKRKSVTFAECIENVLEFFSHRRIISRGRKKSNDPDTKIDNEMETTDEGIEQKIQICESKKRKKHKNFISLMEDDGDKVGNIEMNSIANGNDDVVRNLLINKKKCKRKRENFNLVGNIKMNDGITEVSEIKNSEHKLRNVLNDADIDSYDNELPPAKKRKSKKREDVSSETYKMIIEDCLQDVQVSRKKKKNKKEKLYSNNMK